jgi:hypothetical protein
MRAEFDKLVQELDDAALAELHRSVASEAEDRRRKTAFQFEQIRPDMSAAEKDQAASEIARALREQR